MCTNALVALAFLEQLLLIAKYMIMQDHAPFIASYPIGTDHNCLLRCASHSHTQYDITYRGSGNKVMGEMVHDGVIDNI